MYKDRNQDSFGQQRIPSVRETHTLTIAGKQLTEDLQTTPIEQMAGTAGLMMSGGLVTGGRKSVGDVGINCGGKDNLVSRTAVSLSLTERTLNLNSLTSHPLQVIVFRQGVCDGIDKIYKVPIGHPDAGETDGISIHLGAEDLSVVIAMGKPKTEVIQNDSTRADATKTVFADEEAESMRSFAQKMGIDDIFNYLQEYANFIRLDFKARPGATVPGENTEATRRLDETHQILGVFEACVSPTHVHRALIMPHVFERATKPNGNLVIGAIEPDRYRGVEIDLPKEANVDTRHVLIRTEYIRGHAFAVVEKLSRYGTELFAEDARGQVKTIPAERGIGRVRIPEDGEVSVLISFGDAPGLMLPEHGRPAPDISRTSWSQAGELEEELPDIPIPTGKYRFRLTFRPIAEVTIGKRH